MIKNYLLGDQ